MFVVDDDRGVIDGVGEMYGKFCGIYEKLGVGKECGGCVEGGFVVEVECVGECWIVGGIDLNYGYVVGEVVDYGLYV